MKDFLVNKTYESFVSIYCTLFDASYLIFVIVCMIGLLMYYAGIKKGKDLSAGSIIIFFMLEVLRSCL